MSVDIPAAEAARREAFEEVGAVIELDPGDPIVVVESLLQRIDFVFLRASGLKGPREVYPGSVAVEVVGEDPELKTTPNGLWPSDHGGVVAELGLDWGRFRKFR